MNDNNSNMSETITKYDRIRGGMVGIGITTKPSTVRNVAFLSGKAETFIVETIRDQERGGDFIFVECLDETGDTRLALPPRVADAIARQRESLTKKSRSRAAQARARAMTEADKQVLRDRLARAREKKG